MTEVEVLAPAKVNLTLRILGRRPSGFHDLETLFQAVDLCDRLALRRREAPGVGLRVHGADVGPVEDNLVVRAARAFLRAFRIEAGVEIVLEKRIPAGAGLGGGSSDAGATLRALASLFPEAAGDAGSLEGIAAGLGSDVAFFAGGAGLALGRGRGDVLVPLDPLPPAPVVLGLPPVHVATGPAYGALARAREGQAPPPSLFPPGSVAPDSWDAVARLAVNDFEETVVPGHPLVADALAALRATGPAFALLSGSGAAVFAVHRDVEAAERAREAAAAACPDVPFVACATLGHLPGCMPGSPERVERDGRG